MPKKMREITKGLTLPENVKILGKEIAERISDTAKNITATDLLIGLGAGTLIGFSFVAPGIAVIGKPLLKTIGRYYENKIRKDEAYLSSWQLRRALKYLQRQKLIEVEENNKETKVKITVKGESKIYKYNFEKMEIFVSEKWDKIWRVVVYDIAKLKNSQRNLFRDKIKDLGFHQLQESVYLIPYECFSEIEFLRQYFGVGAEIMYLEVSKIENESVYKDYFEL
ncbi:MAG: hypothetical protein Q7S14_03220 [bacterium]|nr:hypothetical protein [bacterium]